MQQHDEEVPGGLMRLDDNPVNIVFVIDDPHSKSHIVSSTILL